MISSSSAKIETPDGSFDAYLAKPATPNGAGVVVLQEIFGVNANIRGVADRFAAEGYTAIAPDLFWRLEPGVELDPTTDRNRATDLMNRLDRDLAVTDARSALTHLRESLGIERIGAVGFCLGGKLSYLLSTEPGLDAAVSYYGTGIHTLLDRIGEVRCPLLLHVAQEDHLCPPEAQDAIESAAASRRELITVIKYPDVGHAFARRNSPALDEPSADRADKETADFLSAHLLGSK